MKGRKMKQYVVAHQSLILSNRVCNTGPPEHWIQFIVLL